jgi:hypothetical protein
MAMSVLKTQRRGTSHAKKLRLGQRDGGGADGDGGADKDDHDNGASFVL